MGLFNKFKKKNYLKRTDFINSVDSNKIWSKSMTLDEIKESILNDFILNSERSKALKRFEENIMFKFNDYLISQDIKKVSKFIG